MQVPEQVNKQNGINALEQAEAARNPNIKQLRSLLNSWDMLILEKL